MAPPAISDPLIWALFGASLFALLLSTVLYGPTEALEQRLGLPRIFVGDWIRPVGIIGGLLGLAVGMVIVIFF
jgi:hypothetical protein